MFRTPQPSETPRLIALAVATGLFTDEEAHGLLGGVLDEFHAAQLGPGHEVRVWADPARDEPLGWVYYAPSFKSPDVWDLWWIGVDPAAQRSGVGGQLLAGVEQAVREAGGRLLIIETSSTEPLRPAQRFYANRGYAHCGTIPDFYADGDGKLIFAKRVTAAGPRPV